MSIQLLITPLLNSRWEGRSRGLTDRFCTITNSYFPLTFPSLLEEPSLRPAFVGQLDSFILGDDGHIPWEALSHDVYSHSKNVHALGTSHEKVVPSFYTAMVVASKLRRAMKRTHEGIWYSKNVSTKCRKSKAQSWPFVYFRNWGMCLSTV